MEEILMTMQKTPVDDPEPQEAGDDATQADESPETAAPRPQSNGVHSTGSEPADEGSSQPSQQEGPADETDTTERLEAMARERDNLRAEVTELRKSLEEIQSKHEEEVHDLQDKLEESQSSKDHAETQYRTLLGKVNTIRAQLGERLKADAVRRSQGVQVRFFQIDTDGPL